MKEKMLELRLQGKTIQQIADAFGYSRSYVSRLLNNKYNVKNHGGRYNCVPFHKICDIVELRQKGLGVYEIIKQTGVSYPTVAKFIKNIPYEKPKKIVVKKEKVKKSCLLRSKVLSLSHKGLNRSEIAKKLNISTRYVSLLTKGMKVFKRIKKEIVPHEVARDYLGKGFEKGEMPTGVKLREDRDLGKSVSFYYSDFSDKPTVRTTIMVRDESVSDEEAVERWCKKLGKKSWKLIK